MYGVSSISIIDASAVVRIIGTAKENGITVYPDCSCTDHLAARSTKNRGVVEGTVCDQLHRQKIVVSFCCVFCMCPMLLSDVPHTVCDCSPKQQGPDQAGFMLLSHTGYAEHLPLLLCPPLIGQHQIAVPSFATMRVTCHQHGNRSSYCNS